VKRFRHFFRLTSLLTICVFIWIKVHMFAIGQLNRENRNISMWRQSSFSQGPTHNGQDEDSEGGGIEIRGEVSLIWRYKFFIVTDGREKREMLDIGECARGRVTHLVILARWWRTVFPPLNCKWWLDLTPLFFYSLSTWDSIRPYWFTRAVESQQQQ
jgi:hypothetical protein